jgi:hypothetical protein
MSSDATAQLGAESRESSLTVRVCGDRQAHSYGPTFTANLSSWHQFEILLMSAKDISRPNSDQARRKRKIRRPHDELAPKRCGVAQARSVLSRRGVLRSDPDQLEAAGLYCICPGEIEHQNEDGGQQGP